MNMRMRTQAEHIIAQFGGISALAKVLGHKHPTTVQGWKARGWIPSRHQTEIFNKAREIGIDLKKDDFFLLP